MKKLTPDFTTKAISSSSSNLSNNAVYKINSPPLRVDFLPAGDGDYNIMRYHLVTFNESLEIF